MLLLMGIYLLFVSSSGKRKDAFSRKGSRMLRGCLFKEIQVSCMGERNPWKTVTETSGVSAGNFRCLRRKVRHFAMETSEVFVVNFQCL